LSGQFRLPDEMRSELAMPLGRLFGPKEIEGAEFLGIVNGAAFVVTVGDRVTETVGSMGRVPDVQVVDARENRKPRVLPRVKPRETLRAKNPAGSITVEALETIRNALAGEKPARVLVDGEEDLLAVPAIALAPHEACIFYGQPGAGIVLVISDEPAKRRSWALLKRMGVPNSLLPQNR